MAQISDMIVIVIIIEKYTPYYYTLIEWRQVNSILLVLFYNYVFISTFIIWRGRFIGLPNYFGETNSFGSTRSDIDSRFTPVTSMALFRYFEFN